MRAFVWLVLAALLAVPCAGQSPPDALRADIARARERVYPALVNITVVTRYFSEGRALRAPSAGSGVIVTAEGHVLTNYHVAGRTTRIECTLPDGETIEASVVVHDPLTDLSVLKLALNKRADPAKPLPHATLGDSDTLQIGDYVLAMGNPLMLASSLTLGVVSNPKRVFVNETANDIEEMQLDEGETTGVFTRWIQHDATIAPGNSGGPLVNLAGEVVGINELRYGGGIGFAIPSNIARDVLRQALERGSVRRAWLGLTVLPVRKLQRDQGALIASVDPESAAAKAGLKPGDILLSVNGEATNVRHFEEVPVVYQRIAALEPGKPIETLIERGGKTEKITVTPTTMEPIKGEEEEFRTVGATVEEITAVRALLQRLPMRKGVRVTGVRPGYPFEAARPPIQAGDMIVSVGGKPVSDLAEFGKAVAEVPEDGVGVVFRRRGEIIVTSVKPTDDSEADIDTELPKPWLGVKSQVVTADVARALGLSQPGGHRITQVYEGTQAAKAGLQPGDIIISLNGQSLRASRSQDSEDLVRAVENLSLGDQAKLGLLRAGKPETLTVALEPTPRSASKARTAKQRELEFAVREITPMDRMESRRFRGVQGLLISSVTPGGWADMAGLRADDILITVDGKPVADIRAFETVLEGLMEAKPRVIACFVQRGFRTHFVFIEPDWTRIGG
ncbi:MAG: PDZ domain-containing protein [Chthonomonadales bacterium]|nr:PDZ domain-containing protein [Chthonomonadales bacterium]